MTLGQSLSSLLRIAEDRSRWVTIAAEASVGVTPKRLGVTGISLMCSGTVTLVHPVEQLLVLCATILTRMFCDNIYIFVENGTLLYATFVYNLCKVMV